MNADAAWTLELQQGSIVQYNLFTYCQNSPISSYDVNGYARIYIVLKVAFLRDFLTASCSAIAAAICTAILGVMHMQALLVPLWVGSLEGLLGRAYIKRDIKFSVWIPFVRSRTITIW